MSSDRGLGWRLAREAGPVLRHPGGNWFENWVFVVGRQEVLANLDDARLESNRALPERRDQQYAHAMPETSYAMCGDLSLAYQVFGDGPVELIIVLPFVSHLELAWTLPQFKAFC